jgi:hypothetical protein
MKKLLVVSILFSAAAFAESFSGVLVDNNCKGKPDLAAHTTKCAVKCAGSGYGLMSADGKFMKFDDAGNGKALAALKDTKKESDLKATVTGNVETISLD